MGAQCGLAGYAQEAILWKKFSLIKDWIILKFLDGSLLQYKLNYDIVKIQIVEKNLRLILSFYDNIYFVGLPPEVVLWSAANFYQSIKA